MSGSEDETRTRPRGLPRALVALLRLGAWLAALPYAVVVVLVLTGPPTWSAVAYLAGMGALLWGLMTLPGGAGDGRPVRRLRRPRGLARGAVLALLAVGIIRGCTARAGETMAFAPEPRLVARLVDEQDVAVAGTRVLVAGGALRDDADELPSAMRAAYAAMRAEEGDAPSPVLATYLGMQSPSDFDLVVFAPASEPAPREAVVFLHGYAGNFALPCWQMARAVAPLGVLTACPSTRWIGDWWSPDGEATLRRTVDALHARGITRIVLAGLSNGGYGASRLAPRMRGSFVGLVLVSGAAPDAGPSGMPTLVVHGRKDSMARFSSASSYAARTGARLVALDAGHFSMLVRSEENDAAVRAFVGTVLGKRATVSSR
ncbi:MAG: alpha/beta hydrolase [Labilithrix sp.]|nr:alpha/beta hydrolase [Labilithrix sp.]